MARLEFVDHLVFRVSDLAKTESFYSAVLGQTPHQAENSIMYEVGDTRLFFTAARSHDLSYDKESVGLNHLAFGVRTIAELKSVQNKLDEAKIISSGIKVDHYGGKEFIWLDDPDKMRVEFYFRAKS
jgi:glyoxylase I family protein